MLKLDEKLIPSGPYCYFGEQLCPYHVTMRMWDPKEIKFPYCIYLQQGSMPNSGWTNNEFERILKLLEQTEDEIWDHETGLLGLDLLWDGCKECGVNCDYRDNTTGELK